jgi:hypothetical protein
MNIMANLTALIQPASNIVHQTVVYTITVTFTQPHISGNQIFIILPSGMTYPSTVSCLAIQNLSSISCIISSNIIATLSLIGSPTGVSFNLSSIQNYDVSGNYAFTITTKTSSGNGI